MRATHEAVASVARLRGVRAALLATIQDALPIDAVAHVDVDVDALAAFATSLARRARQATEMSRLGAVQLLSLEATEGRVFVARRGELLLIALAGREAHSGLVRVTLQRSLEWVT
jgi:predicted regulator of Ras-like GTPase activity (Roadblock/LC7/MglB family)